MLLILFLAHQFYGMAPPAALASLLAFVCLGAIAFRSLGLIIAAVVNSSQESNILIQPIYMAMLFLSGVTIPITFMPHWLQNITQFIPATYLVTGIGGIVQRGESLAANWQASVALVITTAVATFIATKLFRWEKEEKLAASAKLWVLVVLLPFFFLGAYQAWSQHDLVKARLLARDLHRGHSWLIQNARIFVGNGKMIESGAVLVRQGKIAAIYEGASPDAKSLNAEAIDAAGKTVLPGLIDMHVHLGGPGGSYDDYAKFDQEKAYEHELESYLYCGVTAVRSTGDKVDDLLKLRQQFQRRRETRERTFPLRSALYGRWRPRHGVRKEHAGDDASRVQRAVPAHPENHRRSPQNGGRSRREKSRRDQRHPRSGRARPIPLTE